MRTVPLALLAVALAACGGDGAMTAPSPGAALSPEAPAVPGQEASDCDRRGIDVARGREGRCRENGITFTVVDRDHLLELRELKVRLLDLEIAERVSDRAAGTETAAGAFVILTLAVTNKLDRPAHFDLAQGQARLAVGGRTYVEDFDAENGPVPDSFLFSDDSAIRPDRTRSGKIVFDVPAIVAARLTRPRSGANLLVLDFSDEGAWDRVEEVGVIRLWR
ncbi:MAG: DUF4352 domain-containing protein [Actinomycetota bacterium]|nr:DUF4352 domain-containing protein [Actinomycetota bacterium]